MDKFLAVCERNMEQLKWAEEVNAKELNRAAEAVLRTRELRKRKIRKQQIRTSFVASNVAMGFGATVFGLGIASQNLTSVLIGLCVTTIFGVASVVLEEMEERA